ncbi:murein L,D-transpeptidase catalytic domain-containing protein [Hymenobacter persicinus]
MFVYILALLFAFCCWCLIFHASVWSVYYRLKYFTYDVVQRPHLKDVTRIVGHNPFYDQRHALVIDMALPSSAPRLRVYDLLRQKLVYQTRVMHGKGSGQIKATRFSNRISSQKTALGRYVIVERYLGKFGQAYRLAGIDASNSNALTRGIVLHSSRFFSRTHIGRSEGCPTVSLKAIQAMGKYLREGTVIWIHI